MSDQKPIVGDLFGLQPYAEAVRDTAKAVVGGAGALLGRICLPAAEEFGLALKDQVTAYRLKNWNAIAEHAEAALMKYQKGLAVTVHPRIAASIMSEGGWSEDATLQEMWGGLLASSCKPDTPNDHNLIYVNLLKQLTALEVRILSLACERIPKVKNAQGLLIAPTNFYPECVMTPEHLMELVGCDNIHMLDRDLDHLRSLSLIYTGLLTSNVDGGIQHADITPTILAVSMYVACQGYTGSAGAYFNAPDVSVPKAPDLNEPHFIRPTVDFGSFPPA